MEPKHLAELFPTHELLTLEEAIKELGWITENGPEDEDTGKITCSCGTTIEMYGFIGVDYAVCPDCKKQLRDATGILPGGNSWVQHIDYDRTIIPEDGRVWFCC